MATFHPKLWGDIRARAVADTGSGGLFASGATILNAFTQVWSPPGVEMPYSVYTVEQDSTEEAFRAKGWNVTLDIHTFVEQEHPSGGDPLSTLSVVMDRISGNWLTRSDAIPQYGFDRWTPTLSGTSWTGSPFIHTGTFNNDEPGVYHRVQRFEGFVSRRNIGA